MSPHPLAKLPFAATRVVKASRALSWGAKAVWLEDWTLDRGPEGAWISASNLAARLGMSRQHVDQQRHALAHLGLYTVIHRPGGRTVGWCPILPAACLPPSNRPTPEQLFVCVAALDMILSTPVDATVNPSLRASQPQLTPPSTTVDNCSPEARVEGGGKGGEGSNLSGRETTLQLHEDGEVARGNGGGRTPEDGARAREARRPVLPHESGSGSREASREGLDGSTAAIYERWLEKRAMP